MGGNLTLLFFILLLSYLLRTSEAIFNGKYYKMFPSFYARQFYEMLLWLVLDTMCIVPCLLLHKRNFTNHVSAPQCHAGEISDPSDKKVVEHHDTEELDFDAEDMHDTSNIYADPYDKGHEYSALFKSIRRGSSFRQSYGSLSRDRLATEGMSPQVNNSFIQP